MYLNLSKYLFKFDIFNRKFAENIDITKIK
jgi:hypothetical protein